MQYVYVLKSLKDGNFYVGRTGNLSNGVLNVVAKFISLDIESRSQI